MSFIITSIIGSMVLSALIIWMFHEYNQNKIYEKQMKEIHRRIAENMIKDLQNLKKTLDMLEQKGVYENKHNHRINNLISKSQKII
jgi:hypothetical protein